MDSPKQGDDPMNMYSYKELLEKVRQEYGINSITLSKLTDIPAEIIDHDPDDFSADFSKQHAREYRHLFSTLGFLTEKCQIDEDSYLRGHMNNLIDNFNITKEAISKFIGIELDIIEAFLQGECEIEIEKKYQMSVRFLFMEWLLTKNPYIDI